jgi:hypothetical protein
MPYLQRELLRKLGRIEKGQPTFVMMWVASYVYKQGDWRVLHQVQVNLALSTTSVLDEYGTIDYSMSLSMMRQ